MAELTKYYCDCCGAELQTKQVADMFGNTHTVIRTGTINCLPMYDNLNLSKFGIECCELCAEKISHQLNMFKLTEEVQSYVRKLQRHNNRRCREG